MVVYELKHPSGGSYGTFDNIQTARANALKIIRKHYPKEGKHFAELCIYVGKRNIGMVELGDKYRGRGGKYYDHLSPMDQMGMKAYWENHYFAYPDRNDEVCYKLNADGSLGQKFVYVKGVLGYLPVGYAKKKAVKTAGNTPRKDFMSEHIGVYSVGKNGTLKRVK